MNSFRFWWKFGGDFKVVQYWHLGEFCVNRISFQAIVRIFIDGFQPENGLIHLPIIIPCPKGYFLGAVVIVINLHSKNNKVYITNLFKIEFDFATIKRIYKVGVPNGVGNGMFRLGILLISVLVSTLGTVSIIAYSLVIAVCTFPYIMSAAFKLVSQHLLRSVWEQGI